MAELELEQWGNTTWEDLSGKRGDSCPEWAAESLRAPLPNVSMEEVESELWHTPEDKELLELWLAAFVATATR